MADVIHDTFVLERDYPVGPETVFEAFADEAKKRRWYASGAAHDVESYELDFQEGGAERSRYVLNDKTPFPGTVMATEARHLDIVPGKRVVIAQAMSIGGRRISAALVTFEIEADGKGAKLTCTHQAAFFEGADGPQMRKHGWGVLLDSLGKALAE